MWSCTRRLSLLAVGVASVSIASVVSAQSGSQSIDTRTNIFLSGGNSYGGSSSIGAGLTPTGIALTAGTGRILQLSAIGSSFFCFQVACEATTPDGLIGTATNVNGAGSIGGSASPNAGYLAALFLGPTLPTSLPAQFTVNDANAPIYSPGIGQTFFVGDGSTSGGTFQQFLVPDGATMLYFGLVDANVFNGDPNFYDDNLGTYTVEYTVQGTPASTVPEPSSVLLLSVGLGLGMVSRRKRLI